MKSGQGFLSDRFPGSLFLDRRFAAWKRRGEIIDYATRNVKTFFT